MMITGRGLVAVAFVFLAASAQAQQVAQSRGADPAVDYAALKQIGPWDDRNYALTARDLALLSDNEAEQSEGIPAFFRVELRRNYPSLLRSGPVQYPRSALPWFLITHRGYQVDGKFFRGAQREPSGQWTVLTDTPVAEFDAQGNVRSLEGEVRVTNPTGAAESTIEISPVNPDIVVAGSNGPGSGQKMHFSGDGGDSWTQSANLPLGGTCCDPTAGWSSDGAFAYTATLGSQVWFYRSDDNGATWDSLTDEPGADPRREITAGGFEDKEFLHVDLSPTSPYLDNIYLTWHESNTMRFARSTDFGNTWDPVISFSSAQDKRGIGSDISTDRAGDVYYFWPAFNAREILVAKSANGGASFQTDVLVSDTETSFDFPIPSMETRRAWIYVAADTDRSNGPFADSVYAAWTDTNAPDVGQAQNNHTRIQVAYSRDGGSTWTVTTPHPTGDILTVDRWNQWLTVGPDGTVHVVYYNTLGDPTRTSVNLYYTFSEDGGQTWSAEERLTSQTSPNINDGFEFGDYNGIAATLDHVISVFTDNRNEGGGGGNSVDIYAVGKAIGGGPGPVYTLADTSPGIAGQVNEWTTTNGTPNGGNRTYFGFSIGSTPVSIGQCNVDIGLNNARPVAFATADGAGEATASRLIPAGVAGRTIRFQALDLRSCELSNITTTNF